MSDEVLGMICNMDTENIETQLALQCAPLITGLKLSNLLCVASENEIPVRAFLKKAKMSYYCLLKSEERVVFLIYRRKQLEQHLLQSEEQKLLRQEGYSDLSLGKVLRTFRQRYQQHMDGLREFPHEMGVILGYPIVDVRGFMEHQGKNFLYSGYWKVYANAHETVQLFQKFELAKEMLVRMLWSGVSMHQIIQVFRY